MNPAAEVYLGHCLSVEAVMCLLQRKPVIFLHQRCNKGDNEAYFGPCT